MNWLMVIIRTFQDKKKPIGSCDECYSSTWRPAVTKKQPAKYCNTCGYTEILTKEEFYAQFGRSFDEYSQFLTKG